MFTDLHAGWLWMIAGVLLLAAELLAPGVFLLFVGVAAIATGAFTLLFDLGLASQLVLFVVYAIVAVLVGKRLYAQPVRDESDPRLNDRAAQLVGRSVTVVADVDEHGGRVRVGDGEWSARGGPATAGERVRITGVDGNCLRVEPERLLPPA